jgi:short-subunit dehydrogenase
VQAIATDLGRPAAPAELEREIGRRGLEIDHLVNNAGIGPRGRFEATPLGDHLATIDLNVRTATELAARCLPGMLARRRGGILNIASTAAFQGLVWMPAYAASKAYLVTWSEALWASLRGTGVRCTCVAPGPVDTSFFEANAWGFRPPGWVLQPAGTVAERAIEAYEGDRCLCIPSLPFRLAAWSVRLVPRAVAARLGAFYGRSRPGPAA